MSAAKRRAVSAEPTDPDGPEGPPVAVDMPDVNLSDDQRAMYKYKLNIADPLNEKNLEAEFELGKKTIEMQLNENDSLLDIVVGPKYKDFEADPDGKRVIIQDIIVHNFKSYKGSHQLGPFHKNLTMVMGPNGSGKSNIIDALLFVFGFKSKRIRAQSLVNLIHDDRIANSKETTTTIKMAKVEILFQQIEDIDEEKYVVSPGEAFVIARTITREGSSTYQLNNSNVQFRVIEQQLSKVHIDLTHNRFLILQGEVEAISQMKHTSGNRDEPGMLEYIEELVGTQRFVEPINQLSHLTALLELKVSQYHASCRQHGGHLEKFRAAMAAGVGYLNNQNAINMCKGLMIRGNIRYGMQMRQAAEEALIRRKDELDDVVYTATEARKALREKEREEREIDAELTELTKKKIDAEEEVAKLHDTGNQIRINVKSANSVLVKCEKEADKLKEELEQLREVPVAARVNIQNMQEELEQIRLKANEIDKSLTSNIQKYDNKIGKERGQTHEIEQEHKVATDAYSKAKSEYQLLLSEFNLKREDEENRQALADCEQKLKTEEAKMTGLQKELEATQEPYNEAKTNVTASETTLGTMRHHLTGVESRLQSTIDELNYLSHEDSQRNLRGKTTKVMYQLKESGKFTPFIGRLGDLAHVDEEYDAVMSTIFAGNLDFLVVKTHEDCIAAIDLLYKLKLPRASFFALEYGKTVNDQHMDKPTKLPGKRLFDKVQCKDPDIRRCYYSIMGDILLAKDMEEAVKLDKKGGGRFRVCTMKGGLIERSGALTGGGSVNRGRIQTSEIYQRYEAEEFTSTSTDSERNAHREKLVTRKEQFTRERKTMMEKIALEERNLASLKPILDSFGPKIAGLDEMIIETQGRINSHKLTIHSLTSRLDTAGDSTNAEQELRNMQARLNKLSETVQETEAVVARTGAKVTENARKFELIHDKLIRQNRVQLEEHQNRMKELEAEMAKDQALITNSPEQIRACEQKLAALKATIEDKSAAAGVRGRAEKEFNDIQLAEGTTRLDRTLNEWRAMNKEADAIKADRKLKEQEYQRALVEQKEKQVIYNETLDLVNETVAQVAQLEESLLPIDDNWLEPESLDSTVQYVRIGDPDFDDKVSEGALVMPNDVLAMIEPYREQYTLAVSEIHLESEIIAFVDKMTARKQNLEAQAESFRVQYDEKGISQYVMMVSFQMSEQTAARKYRAKLAAHRKKLNELRQARLSEFSEALAFLGTTTQMLYQLITNGGDASLKFVEEGKSSDPFSGGIKFSVRPAKKSWKVIQNLSGGEKTLASLCFVFAMHHFRATPLYVMDEIDAALDINNVRLIANYIKNSDRTRNAQFIIISLRNQMFDLGPRLVGIYKVDGCTGNVVVNPETVETSKRYTQKFLDQKRKEAYLRQKELEGAEDEQPEPSPVPGRRPRTPKFAAPLNLKDFGIGSSDEDESDEEDQQPIKSRIHAGIIRRIKDIALEEEDRTPSDSEYEESTIGGSYVEEDVQSEAPSAGRPVETDREGSYTNFDEEGDEPIRKKKRRKVAKEYEDASDLESTPTPTRDPSPVVQTRSRRSRL
ncbi:hypothetical protein L5515_003315 [Caenorhabditis briggsae]|uniref:SMC hinge domain-containing protein n=2 Tax=Caenorhabditis briggsae TaxID=6238 RepID=A0AAE9EIU6_CAEBR|nr:hypothetical protein L5515_003315 [Caenorhabditis briggsae]